MKPTICKATATFLLAVSCLSLAGQKIDSLESKLAGYSSEDEGKVELLNQLGFEYWIVNPVQSVIYGQKAIALAQVLNDSIGLAFAKRVVGVAHWAKGSYDDGLSYLFESLELHRQLSDSLGEANCLMNVGLIYSDRLDYNRALTFYYEALKIFEELGESGRSGTTYTKIASIFIDQGKFEAAKDFLSRSLTIHTKDEFEYGKMEVYNRMGLLYAAEKKVDSAKYYLEESLRISNSIADVDGKTKTLLDLAKLYVEWGNLKEAERLLLEGLTIAEGIGLQKWLKEIYENLQIINRKRGDLERAIFYYDQYILARDSVFNEQTINNISRLETQLATIEQQRQLEANEREIIILQQEAEIQNTRIFVLVLALLLVIGVSTGFVRVRQARARKREEAANREAQEISRELEAKNRELASYAVNFVQKNQLFEELIESVQSLKKDANDDFRKGLSGIERIVKRHLKVDKDWEDFKMRFESVHKGFFDELLTYHPSLTNNDLRLSVLIKMNFSIKEIGEIFGISSESVKTARYRLKKKLKLPQERNLSDFLAEIA